MSKCVHVVCFNVPFPADYGGAIDVYYTLKALHDAGIEIILHSFLYDRPEAKELHRLCREVYYYRRKLGWGKQFSLRPYIVNTRMSGELLRNLEKDSYPILFEGLHTCYYLGEASLHKRLKLVRMCNVEHRYYYHLFKAERNRLKGLYYLTESLRLRWYEGVLRNAEVIYGISASETAYLAGRFDGKRVEYMPCFHPNEAVSVREGRGDYLLYHANLSVAENEQAALWLMEHVFSKLDFPAVIAGKDPSAYLTERAKQYPTVTVYANPTDSELDKVIHDAHVHVLVTFQATGLKLKLLNTLYRGRHCVVNPLMTEGSGLEEACRVADTAEGITAVCRELLACPFTKEDIEKRRAVLSRLYDNAESVKKITEVLTTCHVTEGGCPDK